MQVFSGILLLLYAATPLQAQPDTRSVSWTQVHGSVELNPQDALMDAERVAARAVWERCAGVWRANAGMLVPVAELEKKALPWIRQRLSRTKAVKSLPFEVYESSVGKAYRKSFKIQLAGHEATRLMRSGSLMAAEIGSHFKKRYVAISLLWVCLFWLSRRLDFSTRGYLTKRIRLMSAAAGIIGAALLLPF